MANIPVTITEPVLKQIAEELDLGMICHYHKSTDEIVSIPKDYEDSGLEDEFWDEAIEKVEQHAAEYILFEPPASFEAFKIMEGFIVSIPNPNTQQQFEEAVHRKKPFQQFDDLLFTYPDLREQWFTYKLQQFIEYVQRQLEAYNSQLEDDV